MLRRRRFLQSMAALTLIPALPEVVPGAPTESTAGALTRKTRELRIDRKYVLFPVNNESLSRRVRLKRNGRVLRSFIASLGLPAQWWAHLDVSNWEGQTLTLSIEKDTSPPLGYDPPPGRSEYETDNASLVTAVHTSAEIWSPETVYEEHLRPAFHFSSKRGWINDPNGLVYHNGQYHLFFQHNPYGLRWSNMHWGHAVSTDLVHWQELPIALYPRGEDDFPYSGAGVVDQKNTSGWAEGGHPPLVIAYYSSAGYERIAYSNDEAVTWKESGDPAIRNERDSRVLWHLPSKQWVMAVYSERLNEKPLNRHDGDSLRDGTRQGIAFYTSTDLKAWQERSWIEGFIDCPDLFALPVDGDTGRVKWVLSCGPGYYRIGEFDGERFVPESAQLAAPAGTSSLLYAAQTFTNHPKGHVVQIAWGNVGAGDAPFTGLMSFPARLTLRTTSEGLRLCRTPVDSIQSLHLSTFEIPAGPLTASPLLTHLRGDAWDIEAVIEVGVISPITLSIGGDDFVYNPSQQILSGPKGAMPIPLNAGRLRMRVLVDRTTVEIFGDVGQAYGMFVRGTPDAGAPLQLQAWQGQIEKLSVHSLRSVWRA